MSAALDKIPRSPDFIHLDPLMANAKLAEPEYQQKTNKRSQSLLRAAYFRGCPQELSARYGVKLNDGRSFYIQNDGIRTVPPEHVETVLSGGIAPAEVYYCVTKPEFEIYDDSLSDLKDKLFVVNATRFPDSIPSGKTPQKQNAPKWDRAKPEPLRWLRFWEEERRSE